MTTECPLKRCNGQLEVWATGTDPDGTPVALAICNRCGKVAEQPVQPDERQATLDLEGPS